MYVRDARLIIVVCVTAATCCPQRAFARERPHVVAETIEPQPVSGQLAALSLRDGLILNTDSGAREHIATRDLVRITTACVESGKRRYDTKLTLTGGDVLYGRITEGDGDAIVFETSDIGRVALPFDTIEKVDVPLASEEAVRGAVALLDSSPKAGHDRVLLSNGDVVTGFVAALDDGHVFIEGAQGGTRIPRNLVMAVRLVAAPPREIEGVYIHVTLCNSGRVTATDVEWSEGPAEALLRHGQRVSIDSGRIARVDVHGGRWEPLSRHQPISFQHTPMLSLSWQHVSGRNVVGGPITINGETFERGIGVHSRSSLGFDLQGKYRQFVTSFGIDDDSGPYADVAVHILVDGKVRYGREQVRRGSLFGPVRLDVGSARHLELVVDFGENGDIQDRFNWIEPALIR